MTPTATDELPADLVERVMNLSRADRQLLRDYLAAKDELSRAAALEALEQRTAPAEPTVVVSVC